MSVSNINLLEILNNKKDELIKEVEEFAEKNKQADISRNQINLILGIANEASSIKEIINFLKYQIARSKKDEDWRSNNIGENLIKKLYEIYAKAQTEGNLNDQQKKELGMEMVRYFLGYFAREMRYWELKIKKEEG